MSLRDGSYNLDPGVKHRGDKGNAGGAMDPGLRRDDGRGAGVGLFAFQYRNSGQGSTLDKFQECPAAR